MYYTLVAATLLQASLSMAVSSEMGDYIGPGRADRMFSKRAPTDFGTYEVDCAGSEGACNNACYYIYCQANQDPDANKITFIGPNGNNGEADTNRIESGCNFNNPSSGSVCTNFPFSQKFSDNPQATDYQCDEWPPALSQQQAFANKPYPNSLRCMPGGENGSLGSKLGAYVNNRGTYPNRPPGVMSRDDFFRVDFKTNIASADQNKVKFCLGTGTINCGSDGFQFGMTSKPIGGGKISAPYNDANNDNTYALQNTVYQNVYQCSIEFTRSSDSQFDNIQLFDFANNAMTVAPNSCTLNADGDTCTVSGLPNDIEIKRNSALATANSMTFTYAPGTQNTNVNYFSWGSDDSGNGRGPWTDPDTDPNRQPLRFCKVVDGTTAGTQDVECWFPCYEHQDGR